MRWRTAETSVPFAVISSPSRKMRPSWIGSRRFTQRRSVLLPLPLGPMTTSTSPMRNAQIDPVEDEVVAEALAHALETDHRRPVAGRPGDVGVQLLSHPATMKRERQVSRQDG